ncbi:Helix-turn-helix domain-containing protein [Halopenitus malekzadehii]|uniref:Helix-turn-helix domain-containing protein n=1 Tax=Halopenitus malekzadehii TaxID=1267564 RepID=A0A1H6K6I2_9EURY|nr:helix-turn-helix domain-containing protein [Halopenitus malekzadehii]SEH67053.1 Helix-turn-helix domain-containing protein [Halopenitus malekzadehii]
MSEDSEIEDLLEVLDDEFARGILIETSIQPMSAKDLAEACDASLPTIYRRIDRLSEQDLLAERKKFRDEGRHYSVYEATLSRLTIELTDGEFSADVVTEPDDAADRFTDMWEDL